MLLSGCSVYRFSSSDHPAKIPATTVAAASHRDENGQTARFHVAKVRGTVFGGGAGRLSLSPEELNARLSDLWPTLFCEESAADDSIPLTIELGGSLPLYDFCPAPDDLAVQVGLMLVGTLRSENNGVITARVMVGNAAWSDKARAKGTSNSCINTLMLPLPYLMPPYRSDWPSDSHLGGIGYTNTKKTQAIALDLAAVAVLRAVAGLSPQQIAAIRDKTLLDDAQLAAKKRLEQGAKTFSAVETSGDAVPYVETSHEFKADASLSARDIPDVIEQKYDDRTRRGFVRANMSGRDAELAYRFLTQRLIPAICETKNVVLDVSSPPPSNAQFMTLGERKEAEGDVLVIEFEAVQ